MFIVKSEKYFNIKNSNEKQWDSGCCVESEMLITYYIMKIIIFLMQTNE